MLQVNHGSIHTSLYLMLCHSVACFMPRPLHNSSTGLTVSML